MSERKIIENIKDDARISLTLNLFWEQIHEGIRDKDIILKALSELFDEKEKPKYNIKNRRFRMD